jgi:branched-chain amino acid transport system ATP-binding protein
MTGQSPFAVEGFTKSYGALKAVDRVHFSAMEGEILGFCGPNGAGKTTLFDLISGLTIPDEGHLHIDGRPIARGRPDLRIRNGLARTFQLNAAFGSLSIYDNLLLALKFGRSGRGGGHHQIVQIAEQFGLAESLEIPADQISVLQIKMLMLACAVVASPRFILLDEPVAGLSEEEIEQFRRAILDINQQDGTTFLIIEHVMPFLMAVSNRMIFLHEGHVEFDGKPAELVANREIVALFLGNAAAELLSEKT